MIVFLTFCVLVFGSSFDITTGQALTTLKGGLSMDIDVTTLSAFSTEESGSGQFMVLFSDSSNNKAVTAAIGQVL